jgi:hypothetical protein
MMMSTIDAPVTSGADAPITQPHPDAFVMVDAPPATDVCGPAPTQGAASCAMPGPGTTIPECTTDKACLAVQCGGTQDPDCTAECQRCGQCAFCNRQTGQWQVQTLTFCGPAVPCLDGGVIDSGVN